MTSSRYERGDVVWGPHSFDLGEKERPWLVLNDESHPFYGESYLVASLTTTERPEAIPIRESDWQDGSAPKQSFVMPWVVIELKEYQFRDGPGERAYQGRVCQEFVDAVVEELVSYLGTG